MRPRSFVSVLGTARRRSIPEHWTQVRQAGALGLRAARLARRREEVRTWLHAGDMASHWRHGFTLEGRPATVERYGRGEAHATRSRSSLGRGKKTLSSAVETMLTSIS